MMNMLLGCGCNVKYESCGISDIIRIAWVRLGPDCEPDDYHDSLGRPISRTALMFSLMYGEAI